MTQTFPSGTPNPYKPPSPTPEPPQQKLTNTQKADLIFNTTLLILILPFLINIAYETLTIHLALHNIKIPSLF